MLKKSKTSAITKSLNFHFHPECDNEKLNQMELNFNILGCITHFKVYIKIYVRRVKLKLPSTGMALWCVFFFGFLLRGRYGCMDGHFPKKTDWLNLILELLFPRLPYRSHTYQLVMQHDYGWSQLTIGSSVSKNRETC